jgi:integrase
MELPRKSAKVVDVVQYYLHSDQFARLKGSTQKQYELNLTAVLDTVVLDKKLGNYAVRHLKSKHTNLAYSTWLKTGTRTANYRKAALSAAWKHCMRLDVMENDPIRLIKTSSDATRKVMWTRDQVKLFLDTAYSEYKWRSMGLIVHMGFEWAQRIGDMRLLTWDSIDLDAQRLDLIQSKRGADVHLPITDALTAVLTQQKEDLGFQEYVAPRPFPLAGAYVPYAVDKISSTINTIKQVAGLPDNITAMDLRRAAITEMVEAGVDLAGVMQVSGHRSPVSVKPYMVNTFSGASRALAARGNKDDT